MLYPGLLTPMFVAYSTQLLALQVTNTGVGTPPFISWQALSDPMEGSGGVLRSQPLIRFMVYGRVKLQSEVSSQKIRTSKEVQTPLH